MTNPFKKQPNYQFITFTDKPDGRVLLECQNCSHIVTEGKWHRETKILTWKCDECQHISTQEVDINF